MSWIEKAREYADRACYQDEGKPAAVAAYLAGARNQREALLSDEAVERAARAYEAHTTAQIPSEDQEFSCAECGYAFDWREVPHLTPPFGAPAYNTERMLSRRHEHGMRAALTAAIEGEKHTVRAHPTWEVEYPGKPD